MRQIFYTECIDKKTALEHLSRCPLYDTHHFDYVYGFRKDDAVIYIYDGIDRPQALPNFDVFKESFLYDQLICVNDIHSECVGLF